MIVQMIMILVNARLLCLIQPQINVHKPQVIIPIMPYNAPPCLNCLIRTMIKTIKLMSDNTGNKRPTPISNIVYLIVVFI